MKKILLTFVLLALLALSSAKRQEPTHSSSGGQGSETRSSEAHSSSETRQETQSSSETRQETHSSSETRQETHPSTETRQETHSETRAETHSATRASETRAETHSETRQETHPETRQETHSETRAETHSETRHEETRPATSSSGGGDSGPPGERHGGEHFDINFSGSERNDSVELEGHSRDDQGERLRFRFESKDGGISISLRYEIDNIEREYKLFLTQLIFYTETSTPANGFDSNDQVNTRVDLPSNHLDWNAISCTTAQNNNVDCSVSSADGSLTIHVSVVGDTVQANGDTQRPSRIKVTVDINKAPVTVGQYAALVFQVITEDEQHQEDESTEHRQGATIHPERQINFGNGNGFFSWITNAAVGSSNVNVWNSGIASCGAGCQEITFSFDTTASGLIHWDPKLGVELVQTTSAAGLLLPCYVALLALLFALVSM